MVGRREEQRESGRGTVDGLLGDFRTDIVVPWLESWRQYVYRLAMTALMKARASYAAERRRDNIVNYTDLLSAAAALLRSNPDVRQAMQQKYRWILVDEFQDTDPIQAEVLVLLDRRRAVDLHVRPRPTGPPCVCGQARCSSSATPKQSIYRFRRADIDIYNKVRGLVAGIRRRSALAHGVLAVAARGMRAGQYGVPWRCFRTSQPPKRRSSSISIRCVHRRRRNERAPITSGVATLTIPAGVASKDVDEAEAARIARVHPRGGGRRPPPAWRFPDPDAREAQARRRTRPRSSSSRFPSKSAAPGCSSRSPEVATLCLLLTCLADPLDSVSLVGVLRGPLFGVSDQELFEYRQSGGRFELTAPVADDDSAEATDRA